jgi:hypothetical protein
VTQLTAKVRAVATQREHEYTVRHAAYDLKKLRGKDLIARIGTSRRYHVQPHSLRAVAALLTLREHVIAPVLAGVRSPHLGRKPKPWTAADRHYEQLRINMQLLLHDLGIAA